MEEDQPAAVIGRSFLSCWAAAVTMVVAAAAPLSGQARAAPVFPSWFLAPPSSATSITAAGSAPRYATMATSVEEATASAHRAVLLGVRSRVQVDVLLERVGGSTEKRGESYVETMLADSASVKIVDLDTAVVGDMVLILSSTSRSVLVDASRIPLSSTRPAWVDAPPRSDGALVVVGTAPLYFNEHNSWVEAEARARRAAAFEFYSRTRAWFAA